MSLVALVVLVVSLTGLFACAVIALAGTGDPERARRVSFKTLERVNKNHPHGK